MNTGTVYRLPPTLEAACQRLKNAVRAAVERTVESLGLSALATQEVFRRDSLLAAQFELNRKSAIFILAFDEAFDNRVLRDCAPRGRVADSGPTTWDALSLVDDHELEVKVAAERFALEIDAGCEWEVRELEGYLGSVLAGYRDDHRDEKSRNPLRPEVIGFAMIKAAESVAERPEVRKVLVAELGRSMAGSLGKTYAAIVADLRAMGVQPAGLAVKTSAGDPRRAAASTVSGHGPVEHGAADSPEGAQRYPTFGSSSGYATQGLEGSVSRSRPSGPSAYLGQVDAGMMTVIRRLAVVDVGSAHDALHHTPAFTDSGRAAAPVAPNLIRVHRDELRAASSGHLDHMVIDVVGSLFDQILSDPKVPPQMARQIARLQLPVLRAALGDPSFFSSRKHPVRRFVNRIASLGSAFEDYDDDNARALFAKVRELVQAIVEGDFEQIAVYEAQLAALEAFVAEQARAAVVTPEVDPTSLLLQKENQLRLQRLYSTQLQSLLKGLPGPEFLREFIGQVWSEVLLRSSALDGPEGARLKKLRHAGTELWMSVQPKASPQHRKEFLANLPKLMQSLNEGLDLIAWPEAQRRHFFGQLLPAHAEALKNAGMRTLDYNLMARQAEAAIERALPTAAELRAAPLAELPVLADEIVTAPFSAEEAARVGLVRETAVDWDGKVDVDLSAEPEITANDIRIEGLPAAPEPLEPMRGKSLADHVQIGFAYQMNLEGQWRKVRLAHVSPARTFFIFTHGEKQRRTVSLTHRMLVRLCEAGRLRAFENAYLLERAQARARQQLATLKTARPTH